MEIVIVNHNHFAITYKAIKMGKIVKPLKRKYAYRPDQDAQQAADA